jgi:hypothetical protein
MTTPEFEDPTDYRVNTGALNPHLEPRSTHQGGGRGKDDDDSPTRARAVVALRMAGATFQEIADQLSYASARRVRDVFERALAETVDETADLPAQRNLAYRRYERMLSSLWARANNPKDRDHLAYNARAMALIDAEVKLLGLAAPQQINVTRTPDYEEVMAWVNGMASRIRGEEIVVEADILQIEQGEEWLDESAQ